MAAQDYYNSFGHSGATPTPSYSSMGPPPPYNQHPQSNAPGPSSHVDQYNPPQDYGWKPGQQHQENYSYPQHQNAQQQPYHPSQPPQQVRFDDRPQQPQRPSLNTHLTVPQRPHRASSEPPSPIYYDDHSRHHSHSHSHHDHSRHHSHRHRSRSRSHSRDHRSRDGERAAAKARGSNSVKPTFIGALGGSVIGDLIFPGLGTVGGALLGGIGGNELAKDKHKRGGSERPRHRRRTYEEDWEEGRRRRGEI